MWDFMDESPGYYSYRGTITTVNIGSRIFTIGAAAFAGCYNLTNVSFGANVSVIGEGAFGSCTSLTSVTIPSNGFIGDYAFASCSSLTSVTIPSGRTSFGTAVFQDCSGLKTAGPIGGGYNYEFGWTEEIPDDAFPTAKA